MCDESITVALFGDCSTHMAAENYKHTRAVGLTNWLSIVSPSTKNFIKLTQEKLNKTSLTNYGKRICYLNSNKKILEYLLEEKADYLIIDCNDCRKQLIYDDDNEVQGVITDNWFMPEFRECLEIMFGTRGG